MVILKHLINRHEREDYIKVNNALLKALIWFGNRYPEPTMGTVCHPNSKWLIERFETYRKYEGNERVLQAAEAILRIVIAKLEHSPNYRDRISWWLEDLTGWKKRSYGHPINQWNEPKPYGGR